METTANRKQMVRKPLELTARVRETLTRLITVSKEGRLGAMMDGGCVYHKGAKFCAIGYFLTKEEHDFLDDNDKNDDTNAAELYHSCGEELTDIGPRLQTDHGITGELAVSLQQFHDYCYSYMGSSSEEFQEGLQAILDGEALSAWKLFK